MRVAICGMGKAGKALAKKIILDSEIELVLGLCREESDTRNADIGELLNMEKQGIPILTIEEYRNNSEQYRIDVIIDFSHKETTMTLIDVCQYTQTNIVICTTGFSDEEISKISESSRSGNYGVLLAPNLTIGINMLLEFVARISKLLPDFDFEIIERHRIDKPKVTTTAKLISKAIDRGKTPISSIRVGGYVGVHEVTAASESERITIVHESFSRDAFARGAILAARFMYKKKGYYTMCDVISELDGI